MVIALDDGSASCVVEGDGKAVNFSLPPSSSVADLLTEVQSRVNYDLDLFELVLQNDSGHIGLNKLKDCSAAEAGVQFRPDCINRFALVESPNSRIKPHDPPSIVISLVPQGDGKDDASSGTSTNSTSASDAERPPMVPLPSRFKKNSIRYVGLVNQAMTCYLNSLLQALFMTPEFRNALYKWEFVGSQEEMHKSIPYQLQRLFLSLQTSKRSAVETTKLTRSFGWDSSEAWQQHDIQELCRVMFDALEQRMQNTDQADLINDLYEGKMIDYVKCLDCSTEKSREDTFLDIPLPVRPFGSNVAYSSVEEALQAFVLPEILDGNNQYFCEKCNKKCDAHKGLKFSRFPYVLTLHLKRFDFDYSTMHRIKLNDKVEFPQTLNLNKFINHIGGDLASEEQESNGMETLKKDDNMSTTDDEGCQGTDPADTPENVHGSTSGSNSSGSYADMQDYDEGIDLSSGISNHQHHENEKNRLHSEVGSGPPGPFVYELFSIMIHSGSASGGHYYAYVKDFNKGDWFCFNDQSVSRITNEDISRTYGGGANRSYYSGAHSSSTNAYMLMYRQIDKKRNMCAISVDEFPPHLQDLLKRVQEEEEEELIRRERDKDRIRIKLYGRHPRDGKNLEAKLVLDYETTLSDATATAYELLRMDGVVTLEQCRLVHYNSCKSIIDCSFEDQDQEQIGDLLSHTSGDSFFLDIRDIDGQFETYRPGGVVVKVYRVHMETGDVDPPVDIPTQMTATVETLKPQLSKALKLNQNIRVVIEKYGTSLVVLDDDKTLQSAGLYSNKIFVAPAPENESDADFNSKMCEIVERFGNTFTILCSLPETDRESLAKLGITPGTTDANKMVNGDLETVESTSITRGTSRGTSPLLPPLPPPPALDPEEEGLGTTGCSDQSNSEDSSLTDSDRTIVGEEAEFCLAELSSSSNSPQGSDQHNLSSPEDIDPASLNKQQEYFDHLDQIDPTLQSSYYIKIYPCKRHDQQQLVRIQVGKSIMANVLKNALARHLGIGRDHIKLFRKCGSMEMELKDSLCNLRDEEHVDVRLERALRKGELRGKVFQLLAFDEPIKFLSDWILSKYMTVGEAKKQILEELRSKEIIDLPCEKCRLRGKKWKMPGKIYLDTQTFQDLEFQQNWEMFLQELPQGETVTNSSQVTVFVRRWLSSQSKLDDYHEITLQASSYDELREKLCESSGIPLESLKLARPSTAFPHNSLTTQQIQDELKWDTSCSCILEDGAVLFYRDINEEVKHISDPTDEVAWFNRSKHGYDKRDEDEKPASEQTDEVERYRSKYNTNKRHTRRSHKERGLKIIVNNPTPPSHVEE